MKLLRLCAHQISLNQPLPWNVRNEPGQLLLSQGFVLTSPEQIEQLLSRGMYVDADEYEAHRNRQAVVPRRADPFSVWADILSRVSHVLRDPSHPQFVAGITKVSQDVQQAMQMDPEVGTFEMIYSATGGYATRHSLQTAFIAALVAERLGWSEAERLTLIRASLTMNVAMLELQNTLSQQTEPLSPAQRQQVNEHAGAGRQMLERAGVTDQDWLHTVEHHHVTDGGGPLPADRDSVSQLACVVHYADVYLAKMSGRASRPALAVNIAAREMYTRAGGAENPYVATIIKELGIYPPGSFVKLANGDTAVVLRRGASANAPEAHSLLSQDGWAFPDPRPRDTSKPEFKVVASVPRGNVMMRLNRHKLFGYPSD